MDERKFKSLASMAKSLPGDYARGYELGLRRHFYGDRFDSSALHSKRMEFGLNGDCRVDMGRGYRDGFAGKLPAATEDAEGQPRSHAPGQA